MSESGGGQDTNGNGYSEAQPSSLPDLGAIFGAQFQEQQPFDPTTQIAEPNPENVMICLAMLTQATEFRIPQQTISNVQAGLESGAFVFQYGQISALQSESGQAEWAILIGPAPQGVQDPRPPGMQTQDANPADTEDLRFGLNVRGEATGQKVEYTWAELSELPDEALLELGTSRAQVNQMLESMKAEAYPPDAGISNEPRVPREVRYQDLGEAERAQEAKDLPTTLAETRAQAEADYTPKPEGC